MNTKSSLLQAAIVLKSLPKAQVAKVLSRLDAADIQTVLDTINTLDKVTADEISKSTENLNRQASRWKTSESKGNSHKRDSRTKDPAAQLDSGSTRHHHPFDFLVEAPQAVRDRIILDEHPRNIAIILAMLPPETASACMKSLEPVLRFSVFRRLCALDELVDEEVMQLSFAVKLRFKKMMNRKSKKDGISSAAEVLSCTDSKTQQTLLAYMNSSDPDLADDLQKSVLTLEQLADLEDEELQKLLRNVDTSCWAPALKSSSLKLTKRILANMAKQPAEMLNREMASIGDVDEHAARVAAKQIINAAVRLNREGLIQLSKFNRNEPKPLFPSVSTNFQMPSAIPTIS